MQSDKDPFYLTETDGEKRLRAVHHHTAAMQEKQAFRANLWKAVCLVLAIAVAFWLGRMGVAWMAIQFWLGGCMGAAALAAGNIKSRRGKPPSRAELVFAAIYILVFLCAACMLFLKFKEIDFILQRL